MTARNVAAIIGDVFTQVMSGQSSREMIFKMWPIAGEVVEEEKVMTREERRALILKHNKIINKAFFYIKFYNNLLNLSTILH